MQKIIKDEFRKHIETSHLTSDSITTLLEKASKMCIHSLKNDGKLSSTIMAGAEQRKSPNSLYVKNGFHNKPIRHGSGTDASDIGDILNTENESVIDIRRGNDSEA